MVSHTRPHRVPSIYSPDNCCCRRIPLRVSAPPSYPYNPRSMLASCPLKPVWFSPTDHLSTDGTQCSSSIVSPLPYGNSSKSVPYLGSLSDTMDTCTPCSRIVSLMYNRQNSSSVKVIRTARKCADLMSRSTITHTTSCLRGFHGKWVTKSIVTCSHFHLDTSNGWSRPAGF